MFKGFIVGLIVGFLAMAALMVAFPTKPLLPPMTSPASAPAESGSGGATAPAEGSGGSTEQTAPSGDGSSTGGASGGAMQQTAPSGDATQQTAPSGGGTEQTAPAETPPAQTAPSGSDSSALTAPTEQASAAPPVVQPTPKAPAQPAEDGAQPRAASAEVPGKVETGEPARVPLPTVQRPEDSLQAPTTALADQPAWRRNATPFKAEDDRPLLAIVLTVTGSDTDQSTPLSAVPAPLTLALPASVSEAASAARLYRRAGFETLVMLPFSGDAGGLLQPGLSDTAMAEAVRGLFGKFDSVVGVANSGGGAAPDGRVSRVMMDEMARAGLGYLQVSGGALGGDARAAEERGVPAALHVRVLPDGLSEPEILKTLDLAAFDARRRGAAVAVGAPSEAMVRAVIAWAREKDGSAARLAPFSAVLARLARTG